MDKMIRMVFMLKGFRLNNMAAFTGRSKKGCVYFIAATISSLAKPLTSEDGGISPLAKPLTSEDGGISSLAETLTSEEIGMVSLASIKN